MMGPTLERLRRLWDLWDIRVLVLVSLTLQIILFIFGNCRKYMSLKWINIFVWLAYLGADSIATFALGNLSHTKWNHDVEDSNKCHGSNMGILAFVAPWWPDTITAYSLEDNQLWLRHLLVLGVQATVAVFVIFFLEGRILGFHICHS
ncbi:hypothetical protein ACSBR2_006715 [Camellia fascicularis]